ncbi:MAG: hypothetical protein COA66_16095 [Arcobacter sp.]|nr:MAG: hypothetical protein COA66_16095 [Arcobacter sp.]
MFNKKIILFFIVLFSSMALVANVSLKQENLEIFEVMGNKAKIAKGNLAIGQSGIINHKIGKNNSIILASAEVIETYNSYSVIQINKFNDLLQEAIPNTTRKVQNKDIFILNYLYSASLLIAPNQDSFINIRQVFSTHNFVHSDIFASHLKIEGEPFPSKEFIKEYTTKENIGTIFYAIDQRVYIFDAKSFKKIASFTFPYDEEEAQLPFYTRVEKIEEGQFSWLKGLSWESMAKMLRTFGFLPKENEYDEYELEDEDGNIIENSNLTVTEQYNLYYIKFLGLADD